MKKLFLALMLLIFMPLSTQAQEEPKNVNLDGIPSGTYVLDKTHASLIWKVSHLGLSDYTARFTDFDAEIEFNAEDPTKSTLKATINPFSVETDYPTPEKKDFDKELATQKKWFNGDEFPEITFTSNSITKIQDDIASVEGSLKMLGVSKPVRLLVRLNGALVQHPFAKKPALGFSATSRINRSEWGMGTYIPTVGDEVSIQIEAEFLKK